MQFLKLGIWANSSLPNVGFRGDHYYCILVPTVCSNTEILLCETCALDLLQFKMVTTHRSSDSVEIPAAHDPRKLS